MTWVRIDENSVVIAYARALNILLPATQQLSVLEANINGFGFGALGDLAGYARDAIWAATTTMGEGANALTREIQALNAKVTELVRQQRAASVVGTVTSSVGGFAAGAAIGAVFDPRTSAGRFYADLSGQTDAEAQRVYTLAPRTTPVIASPGPQYVLSTTHPILTDGQLRAGAEALEMKELQKKSAQIAAANVAMSVNDSIARSTSLLLSPTGSQIMPSSGPWAGYYDAGGGIMSPIKSRD